MSVKKASTFLLLETAIVFLSIWIGTFSLYVGFFSFVFLNVAMILQGMRKIETKHHGIVKFFGKRQSYTTREDYRDENGDLQHKEVVATEYENEGWRFLPLQGFAFDVDEIKTEALNDEPAIEGVRTPDMAELKLTIGVTFEPWPKFLINYDNKGGDKQVKQILRDVISGAVRDRAIQGKESYEALKEYERLKRDKKIQLPSFEEFYFEKLRGEGKIPPLDDFEDHKGKLIIHPHTWNDAVAMRGHFLMRVIEKMMSRHDTAITPQDEAELKQLAEQLEDGGAIFPVRDLGIIIKRINIKRIEPMGELYKDAENLARERAQKEGEHEEIVFVREEIKKFVEETGLSPQESSRTIQTERKKATYNVNESRLSMSPEVASIIKPVTDALGKIVEIVDKKTNPDTTPIASGIENGLKHIADAIKSMKEN